MTKKIDDFGLWEQIHNPGFQPFKFDEFRMQAGLNRFTLKVPNLTDLQQMKQFTADEPTPRPPGGKEGK